MKHFVTELLLGAAAIAMVELAPTATRADEPVLPVDVKIYSTVSSFNGSGAPYSNLALEFQSSDIKFGTNAGFNWLPIGNQIFGADMTGFLNIPTTGTYNFTLTSDDGSQLFIDFNATPVVDDGGLHGPTAASGSVFLSAGTHAFEVQFFECCGVGLPSDASGVDLTLPEGVRYGFAGTVGDANCHGQSVSSLARQFGGLGPAAANLGFSNVRALRDAIKAYCGT